MADRITAEQRSRLMAAIRGKDTTPERTVRRLLHAMGHRFRLHVRTLPGRPDIVLARHRKIVLVHGCFWHRHAACGPSEPASNVAYWQAKFANNVRRDRQNLAALRAAGWRVLVVWECQLRDLAALRRRLRAFMARPAAAPPARPAEPPVSGGGR